MESIKYFLNNVEINEPFNWKETSLELNFDKDVVQSQVKTNEWRFVRENADVINDWIQGGITGGVGIMEGIPFRIEVSEGASTEVVFNGYLDLSDSLSASCEDVTVTAKEKARIDWLNDVAEFSFEYLFEEEGIITKDDFIFMPYIISTVPNYKDAMLATVTVFAVVNEIKAAVSQLAALLVEMANPFEATAIIRAGLYVVYLVLLITALVKLIKDFMLLIIQPVKYHACMKAVTLWERACEHLGLTFKSSIFYGEYANMVIIPQKHYVPESQDENKILGFLNPNPNEQIGYYKGSFGEFIRAMKNLCNGKVVLDGTNLIFEREDYAPSAPGFTIPPIENRINRYNTNEFNGNFLVEFLTDGAEKNTVQQYTGTSYQVTLRPYTYHDNQLVLMKGLSTRSIPFALAKRKESLTIPENVILEVLDIFDSLVNGLVTAVNFLIELLNKIIKVINKIIKALGVVGIDWDFEVKPIKPLVKVNFTEAIENRIGMMLLETDQISVPKVFLIEEGSTPKKNKIAADNATKVSAKYSWQNFHHINSFMPSTEKPNGNQYLIKDYKNVPFCLDHYMYFKDNNKLKDSEGREGQLISLTWNIFKQTADMRVKLSELYTNNLRSIEYEPTGK